MSSYQVYIVPTTEAPATAREIIDRYLAPTLDEEVLADIRLGVSEIVTEIVANTSTRWLCLNLEVEQGSIHIEVLGTEDVVPIELLSPLLTQNFTPQVMDGVTDRWGLRRDGSSTLWFEKDVATQPAPPAKSADPEPAVDPLGPATQSFTAVSASPAWPSTDRLELDAP